MVNLERCGQGRSCLLKKDIIDTSISQRMLIDLRRKGQHVVFQESYQINIITILIGRQCRAMGQIALEPVLSNVL
jgi:hypothetical protein